MTMQVSERKGFARLHASKVSSAHCLSRSSISKQATRISSQDAENRAQRSNLKSYSISSNSKVLSTGCSNTVSAPKCITKEIVAADAQLIRRTSVNNKLLPNPKGTVLSTPKVTGPQKECIMPLFKSTRKTTQRLGYEDLYASKSSSTKHLTASRDCTQAAGPSAVPPKPTKRTLRAVDAQTKNRIAIDYKSPPDANKVSATLQEQFERRAVSRTCGAAITACTRKATQTSGPGKPCVLNNSSTMHLTASRDAKKATRDRIKVSELGSGAPKCTRQPLEAANAQSMHRTAGVCKLPPNLKGAITATVQVKPGDRTGVPKSCYAPSTRGTRKVFRTSDYEKPRAYKNSSTNNRIASKNCFPDVGSKPVAKKSNQNNHGFSSISTSNSSGCSNSKSKSVCTTRQLEMADRQPMPRTERNHHFPPRKRVNMVTKKHEGELASRTKSLCAYSSRKIAGSPNTRLPSLINTNAKKAHLVMTKAREYGKSWSRQGMLATQNPHRPLPEAAKLAQAQRSRLSFRDHPWNSSSRSPVYDPASICNRAFEMRRINTRNHSRITNGGTNTRVSEVPWTSHQIVGDRQFTNESLLGEDDDQHWELRMDIDNMSYEELLALEEQMGSVNTGLTDETLTRCLKRINLDQASSASGILACAPDEKRCCICQEECVDGEEIGVLECVHWFHSFCIERWLRMKNWCPICKESALLSREASCIP